MNRHLSTTFFVGVVGLSLAGCGGGAESRPPPVAAATPPDASSVPNRTPPSSTGMTFADRCGQPGVVKCVGFDSSADFNTGRGGLSGAYGLNSGIMPPSGTADYTRATMDTAIKASGNGALKFTIPSNSGADTSGTYFTNFSSDLSVQFGENSEFFVQWRQRFSPEYISTQYTDGGGWKQAIITTGDQGTSLSQIQSSCTAIGVVVQNHDGLGFPKMYNSCTGSTSHGPYDNFFEKIGTTDFKLQNGRAAPYCLYTQSKTSYFPPVGNCFGYVPDEWMTFQVRIKTGPRVGDEFSNSYVTMWAAREGQPSELVVEWGPYNLTAGSLAENQKFGKVWLLPYNTKKNPTQSHPTAYTWYDELIVSRNRIADP